MEKTIAGVGVRKDAVGVAAVVAPLATEWAGPPRAAVGQRFLAAAETGQGAAAAVAAFERDTGRVTCVEVAAPPRPAACLPRLSCLCAPLASQQTLLTAEQVASGEGVFCENCANTSR